MLFTELTFGGRSREPEVYPRLDGTVYLCGAGGEDEAIALPERADQVKPVPAAIQRLKEAAAFVSPDTFGDAEVVAEQCCFRPNSQTGLPVIGKVREGFVASGWHLDTVSGEFRMVLGLGNAWYVPHKPDSKANHTQVAASSGRTHPWPSHICQHLPAQPMNKLTLLKIVQ
ncbi:DAO domain-containing protein [Rhizoctonia solani AG-1 IA]|uniref:DAO domain-containing protein n=1 Tax=Thanatephorus cucumeris (strain AG1-IA) TaxID=983506 RepID=L8X3D2_THACA|nr:DAO domain-containing protein [Rhizoctonia solani AG-1 IA]